MSEEGKFRDKEILPMLRSFGYAIRIENSIGSDLGDLIYCIRREKLGPGFGGWIEIKHAYRWPVREKTVLRFKHFTIGQANWLSDWYTPGSKTSLLAKVGCDYFLLPGTSALRLHNGMTRSQIMDGAAVTGINNVFPAGRIVRWLTER